MTHCNLTLSGAAATHCDMQYKRRAGAGGRIGAAILLAGSTLLGGCINVNAPSEPIVIELNINIRQEVIYRLAEDAGNTIEENADIF